jgi:thioredoxin family protein
VPRSVHAVPYIVRPASLADVPARIVDRRGGQAIMQRHRASDGRTVTPVVVLFLSADDVGAWIERPRALL